MMNKKGNPYHVPKGSSEGGQFTSGQLSTIEDNARQAAGLSVNIMIRKGVGKVHQTELISNQDDSKRQDIMKELRVGIGEEPSNAGMQEIHSAVGDVENNLLIKRNSRGQIVAAASYSIEGGYNIDGNSVSMLHINHIGSIQAGEGISLVSTLESVGKKQNTKGIVLESRVGAREYWAKTGFTLLGNSANRFVRKIK